MLSGGVDSILLAAVCLDIGISPLAVTIASADEPSVDAKASALAAQALDLHRPANRGSGAVHRPDGAAFPARSHGRSRRAVTPKWFVPLHLGSVIHRGPKTFFSRPFPGPEGTGPDPRKSAPDKVFHRDKVSLQVQ